MRKWDSGSQKSERVREVEREWLWESDKVRDQLWESETVALRKVKEWKKKESFFKTSFFFKRGVRISVSWLIWAKKKSWRHKKSSCSSFLPFQVNAKTEQDGIRRRYLLWTAFVTFDVFRDKVLLVLARWDWLGIFGIGRKSLFSKNSLTNGG